jgi:lipopolysaccharide transport system permease protein
VTFLQFRSLFRQLVVRDIKLKYRGSYIGYLWSIVNPLLTMLVLVAVFGHLLAKGIPNFAAYIISGEVIFSFITDATKQALGSIRGSASLLKKTYVPKYIFTLSRVTSSLVTMLLSMGAAIIVFVFTGVRFHPIALLFFLPIVQAYVFSLGLGFFLAQAAVFFKDIKFIYSVFCTAWFYVSAILYDISILPDWLRYLVVNYNPAYLYIAEFRNVIYQETMFPLDYFVRGWLWAGGMLAFGLFFFIRSKDKFILYL